MAYRIDSRHLKEQKITACFSKTKRQHALIQGIMYISVSIFTGEGSLFIASSKSCCFIFFQ